MSCLPEHLRTDLDRAMNGDGEVSDELAKAISSDPELMKAWEHFMRNDRIGFLLSKALAEKPPCPNANKSMPEGCPYCGGQHGVPT